MRNGCFGFSVKRCWQTRKGKIINFYDINKIMFRDWFFRLRPVSTPHRIVSSLVLLSVECLNFNLRMHEKKAFKMSQKFIEPVFIHVVTNFENAFWYAFGWCFTVADDEIYLLFGSFWEWSFCACSPQLILMLQRVLDICSWKLAKCFQSSQDVSLSHSLMALSNIACCMNIKNQPAQCLTRIFAPKYSIILIMNFFKATDKMKNVPSIIPARSSSVIKQYKKAKIH